MLHNGINRFDVTQWYKSFQATTARNQIFQIFHSKIYRKLLPIM